MGIVEFPGAGSARNPLAGNPEDRSDDGDAAIRDACPAVMAYERVCAATDNWSERIPGEDGDREAMAEIEQAYEAFFQVTPRSLEGLRLQFESLVAVTDLEGELNPHPGILVLVQAMREGFEAMREGDRDARR